MDQEDRDIMKDVILLNVHNMTQEKLDKLTDEELAWLYYNEV